MTDRLSAKKRAARLRHDLSFAYHNAKLSNDDINESHLLELMEERAEKEISDAEKAAAAAERELMECGHPRACFIGLRPHEPCDRIGGCLHELNPPMEKCKCDSRGYCSACTQLEAELKPEGEESTGS